MRNTNGLMDTSMIFQLGIVFASVGVVGLRECSAIAAKRDPESDAEMFDLADFTTIKKTDTFAYIEHRCGGIRLKIIPHNELPHDIWIVRTRSEYEKVTAGIAKNAPSFEQAENRIKQPDLRATMFRCKKTGALFQIVWRRTQVFKSLVFR